MNNHQFQNPSYFELANGVRIPSIGYGTWKVSGQEATDIVKDAIDAGYRLIDTAAMYGNEKEIGTALAQCGVNREDLFITSKVVPQCRHYDQVIDACTRTLEDLGLDYLDLYLVHWPANALNHPDDWNELNLETWRAMTDLYKQGKVRAIGVSNFLVHHLKPLMETEVPPMVDQIEFHPGWAQQDVVDYCQKNGVLVEAWSPLGRTRVLQLPELEAIAREHNVSTAKVCLRYALQKNVLPLPKSTHIARMIDNMDVFGFTLTTTEMEQIDMLVNIGFSGHDPETYDDK